ncbi:MAG TPA: glycosyltransferase family 39 protein [Thermoanaerobaculia bacterium]|nr:glycosyltransferase family 39 protein [Thermoanaerobaculia bacterium]
MTRRDLLPLGAVAAVFIALRLPLFVDPALHLGWNSDAVIFGMMAKAIAAGRELPLYFWRQSYMGVMTSYLTVPLLRAISAPAALRIASAAEVLAGIVFYWLGLRRAFGQKVATIDALWMAIGPGYMMLFVVVPVGGEQMFVLSAIIYWLAEVTGLQRPRDWFFFGLLFGFGWWQHQGIIFAAGAAVIAVVLRSEWWTRVRDARPPRRNPLRIAIASLLAIDVLLALLHSLGARVPFFFILHPVADPLVAFVLVAMLNAPRVRAMLRVDRAPVVRAALFVAGALIAYSPVLIGKWRGVVPQGYGLSVPPNEIAEVARHIVTFLGSDLWLTLGAAAAVVIVPFFIVAMLRRPPLDMPLVTIILCVLFYVFSQRAHPGSMRYIVSAVPMVYAFAAQEMLRLRARMIPVAVATLALLVPRVMQVRDVARGEGEQYGGLPADFDPRPTLRIIEAKHYDVCYAGYWVAYKLQWVSDERVRFIPYRSFDRNPAASRALAAAPGPKCYVNDNGHVRAFDPRELTDDVSRKAAERLRRLRGQ